MDGSRLPWTARLYPTVAQWAGLKIPPHCQGKSLTSVLRDPQASVRQAVYCVRGRNDHLLRTERWAYIRYDAGSSELYDMEHDPYQFTNLANQAEWRTLQQQLDSQLQQKLDSLESQAE